MLSCGPVTYKTIRERIKFHMEHISRDSMGNAAPATRPHSYDRTAMPSFFRRASPAPNHGFELSEEGNGEARAVLTFPSPGGYATRWRNTRSSRIHHPLELTAKTLGENETVTSYNGLFTKLYFVRLRTSRKTRCSKLKTRVCLVFTELSWILSCNRGNTYRAVCGSKR